MTEHQRVLIGICTCKRLYMLEACLESLMLQLPAPDLHVEIAVIDNDERGASAREVIEAFRSRSPFHIHYIHEPRRGIPIARNRVLDVALGRCFDWIAFIDDDETAESDWLTELMAPEYRNVPVLSGKVEYCYPEPLPFWAAHRQKRQRAEGEEPSSVATNNVRIAIDLIRSGLRFNEGLGLMGGEDQEFFAAARDAGFEIRQTQRALTRELFHAERLTYAAQIYRSYWCAVSDVRRAVVRKGRARTMLAKAPTVPINVLLGALQVAVSPLFAIAGLFEFKRRALSGGKQVAKGIGRAASMVGHLPQPYRRIVGR